MSNLEHNKFIRKLVIIALFADDYLMNTFVLKGGNALDIIYNISDRASIDIDVSITSEFTEAELTNIQARLEISFDKVFSDHNYSVFDLNLKPKPKVPYAEIKDFWGGYALTFKIIDKNKSDLPLSAKQKQALPLGPKNSTNFKVDISKFEYCKPCAEVTLDDYTIYVYTPVMIVFEKLRAICQQMSAYANIVKFSPRARARDFFDIYTIIEKLDLQTKITSQENMIILRSIFDVKRVPVELLLQIENTREFHKISYPSVIDTISNHDRDKDFDFYFDYVLSLVSRLETLWKK